MSNIELRNKSLMFNIDVKCNLYASNISFEVFNKMKEKCSFNIVTLC